jgi:hypothetical protein
LKNTYTKNSPEEVAASPRLETNPAGQDSTKTIPTNRRHQASVSVEDQCQLHAAFMRAERLAAYACAAIRGRTAAEVAAEVGARAIASLRSKHKTEAARREVEQ